MSTVVKIDEFADALNDALTEYNQEITDGMKLVVDKVSKEVMREIKANITFDEPTGKYVKAFRIKTVEETKFNLTKAWHVIDHQHGLTHLLEKGHALRGGGMSRAFPHIVYGDALAKRRMEELAKEVVENVNKP